MKYFQELHYLHEKWLSNKDLLPAPVLIIDANVDLGKNPDAYSKYDKEILQYFRKEAQIKKPCLQEMNSHMNHLVI